jgi:hypothetical protein
VHVVRRETEEDGDNHGRTVICQSAAISIDKDDVTVCSEAAFHELGVYSKNDGNAVGIFSPKNVRND